MCHNKMSTKIARHFGAVLLALLFLFSQISFATAAAEEGDTDGAFKTGVTYSVPIDMHVGTTRAYGSTVAYANQKRVNFNQYAMIQAKQDGGYDVRLQFFSYGVVDAIQVVDPIKTAAAMTQYPIFGNMKMGTINLSGNALISALQNGWTDAEFNDWYLKYPDVTIGQKEEDAALELGYVTIHVPNLEQPLLIKAYAACANQAPDDTIVYFNAAQKIEMPDIAQNGIYEFSRYLSNESVASDTQYNLSANPVSPYITDGAIKVNVTDGNALVDIPLTEKDTDSTSTGYTRLYAKSISKPMARNISASLGATALNQQSGMAYEAIMTYYNEGPNTLSYTYENSLENLVFGKPFKITHISPSNEAKNRTPADIFTFIHLLPQIDYTYDNGPADSVWEVIDSAGGGQEPGEENTNELSNNDLTLTLNEGEIQSNMSFSAPDFKTADGLRYFSDGNLNAVISLAAGEAYYKAYAVSFTDNTGSLEPEAVLKFALPQSWTISNLRVMYASNDNLGTRNTTIAAPDYINQTVSIRVGGSSGVPINSDFLFIQNADPINPYDAIQSDGLYKARVVSKHATMDQASMSNGALTHDAYIESVNGKLKLYLGIGTAEGDGVTGMVRNVHMYPSNLSGLPPVQSTHLEYASNPDGSLDIDEISRNYNLIYIKRVSMDLGTPATGNTYWARFDIPAMDGMAGTPGDFSGSRDARLLILTAEKIEDASNPLAGYDKTILRAKIDEAQRLVATLNTSTDSARIEELAAAVLTAKVAYNNASITSEQIKEARDALAAVVGTTGGGTTPGEGTPEPDDQDNAALAPGDYPTDIKLWNFSGNYASMGNAALIHDQSFVRVKDDGTAEAHLFFKALTFTGLTGHLEKLSLVTNIQRDEYGIVTKYDKSPATVIGDYAGTADATDEFGPINTAVYPHEVSIPVEIGKAYTTVEVFVPVMEKAVGGAGTQLARLQIDWSSLGVDETPEPPVTPEQPAVGVPVTKTPEATESVSVTAPKSEELKTDAASGVTKAEVVVNASAETVAKTATDVATKAKEEAVKKVAAGTITANETVVAEIKIEIPVTEKAAALETARTQNVTVVDTVVSSAAIKAIVTESTKADNENVELVLTVESALASGLTSVTLDAATLAQVVTAAGTSETIAITVTSDATALTPAQTSILAGKVPIAVTISAGSEQITELASEIAITIPYVKASGSNKKVVVWYVPAIGDPIKHNATYEEGRLTFTTDKI